MKYIKTFKIVTPIFLAGGVLVSIALADQTPSDHPVHLSSSSFSASPTPSATPTPSVSMTVNGKAVPVGSGDTHYSDGQANVSVHNSNGSVSAQATTGPDSTTNISQSGDGNVSVSVDSHSTGGNSWSSTQVFSNDTSYSSSQQSTSISTFDSGTH